MQKLRFPMEYLRVTQGYGYKSNGSVDTSSYSHAGTYAMDFGGKDTGSDPLYCPCDMVVKRCRQNANGELYLESTLPVELADGTTDYVHLLFIHDSSFNVVEGQVLTQGYHFYDEGGMGSGNPNKFGTHVHIEGGKGKWKSTTQSKNAQGVYACENMYPLHKMFILGDDVVILDDGGHKWMRVSDMDSLLNNDETIYGVDVSHNRSKDIIAKIRDNGKAKFAILRACVGSSSEDDHLAQYLKDIGDMKIGFFPASYFNSLTDASAEAKYLIDTIEKYGFTPEIVDLPIFCDWEGFSYEYNKKNGVEITPAQLREFTKVFCEYVKQRGYKAGVYLNKDYWDNWYGQAFFDDHPDYYIWYARPGLDAPDRDCYLWQYACDNGSEYGVNEPLDKNILFGEFMKPAEWKDSDQQLEIIANNCEYFETTDVSVALGKLVNGEKYDVARTSIKSINGFDWAEIIYIDGSHVFVAMLDDRCKLIEKVDIRDEKIKTLESEIKQLQLSIASKDTEIMELNDQLVAKNNECSMLIIEYSGDIEALKKELDVSKILARELDMNVSQLNLAMANKEEALFNAEEELMEFKDEMIKLEGQLEKQMAENVLLKEECSALKKENEELKSQSEKIDEIPVDDDVKKSLISMLIETFFAWLKGV